MFEVGNVVRYIGGPAKDLVATYADLGLSVGDLGVVVRASRDRRYAGCPDIPVRFFMTPYPLTHEDRGYWVMKAEEIQKEQSNG